jgi:hypothetical protein
MTSEPPSPLGSGVFGTRDFRCSLEKGVIVDTSTITMETAGVSTSRAQTAWLWLKELARKARQTLESSYAKVRMTIGQVMGSTAAAVATVAGAAALATKRGWQTGVRVATRVVAGALGLVTRGVGFIAKAFGWIFKGAAKVIGLVNKDAAAWIENKVNGFNAWIDGKTATIRSTIDQYRLSAETMMTARTASGIGRIAAAGVAVGTLANLATSGVVAAKVGAVAGVGPFAAAALTGPVGFLLIGAAAVIGGIVNWFFRKNEVAVRSQELAEEREQNKVADLLRMMIASGATIEEASDSMVEFLESGNSIDELIVKMRTSTKEERDMALKMFRAERASKVTTAKESEVETELVEDEDGKLVLKLTGEADAVHLASENADKIAEQIVAGALAKQGLVMPLDPSEVTDEIVIASLEETRTTKRALSGTAYSKAQKDDRRKKLIRRQVEMPKAVSAAS